MATTTTTGGKGLPKTGETSSYIVIALGVVAVIAGAFLLKRRNNA